MSTWEDRMSARAAARREAAEAERQREEARPDAEFPRLDGEGDILTWDDHYGHRTHIDGWHPGSVICSCGAFMGVYSFALTGDEPEPEPCPVCIARGIPLGAR